MEAMLEEQGLSYLTATGAVFLAYGIWNQVEGRKKNDGEWGVGGLYWPD